MLKLNGLLLGALSLAGSLSAGGFAYYNRECSGPFEVGGQALYWRSLPCNLNAVISDPRPFDIDTIDAILPEGAMLSIDPDYEWGARVFVGHTASDGCQDVRVSYIYFHQADRATYRPQGEGGLWAVFSFPETIILAPVYNGIAEGRPLAIADAKATFDYDSVDLQLAARRRIKQCWKARAYLGLHFANIDHAFKVDVIGTAFPAEGDNFSVQTIGKSHQRTWGVGPLVGCDCAYQLCHNIAIEGKISGGLMVGDTCGSLFNFERVVSLPDDTVTEREGKVSRSERAHLVPHIASSLGLSYCWMWDCLRLTAEIGWEFRTYINALEEVRFNDERATESCSCDSFRLNGLFFGLKATL